MSEVEAMTLTDFLLARIAEDEAMARAARTVSVPRVEHLGGGRWGKDYIEETELGDGVGRAVVWAIAPGQSSPGSNGTNKTGTALFERFSPARVLAECEAKRRIVALHTPDHECTDGSDSYPGVFSGDDSTALGECLRALALPYADHPDYREEWRA